MLVANAKYICDRLDLVLEFSWQWTIEEHEKIARVGNVTMHILDEM